MKKFLYGLVILGSIILVAFVVIVLITTNCFSDPTQYLADVRYCGCTGGEVYEKINKHDPNSGLYRVVDKHGGQSWSSITKWGKDEFNDRTKETDTCVMVVNINHFIGNCLYVAWKLTFKNGIVVRQESVFAGGEGPPFLHCESLYDYHPAVYTLDTPKLNIAPDSSCVHPSLESTECADKMYIDQNQSLKASAI